MFCRERKNKGLKEAVKPQASPTPSLESVLNRVWKRPPPGEATGFAVGQAGGREGRKRGEESAHRHETSTGTCRGAASGARRRTLIRDPGWGARGEAGKQPPSKEAQTGQRMLPDPEAKPGLGEWAADSPHFHRAEWIGP